MKIIVIGAGIGGSTLALSFPLPSFLKPAVQRPLHRETPKTQPYPILRYMSRPRFAARCLAAGRFGGAAAHWGRRHCRGRRANRDFKADFAWCPPIARTRNTPRERPLVGAKTTPLT
jgi:hypothetical protein